MTLTKEERKELRENRGKKKDQKREVKEHVHRFHVCANKVDCVGDLAVGLDDGGFIITAPRKDIRHLKKFMFYAHSDEESSGRCMWRGVIVGKNLVAIDKLLNGA